MRAVIADGRDREIKFVLDAQGQVLQRDQNPVNVFAGNGSIYSSSDESPRQIYYYFNGLRVGDISNDGSSDTDYVQSIADRQKTTASGWFQWGANDGVDYADFDQSYDPLNGLNYETNSSRYTVQTGDTLDSIALALWGDASYWYMIADANGLSGSETLVGGMSLIIPNKVHNSHNNADTYRVYDPNEATGNISPTMPKKPKKGCGIFGMILMIVVAVAVTAITAGALAAPAGQGILGGLSALAAADTVAGPTLGTAIGIGAASAAIGSAVSQGVGIAVGAQSKFSWKSVAMAGLTGAITAGLGASGIFGRTIDGAFKSRIDRHSERLRQSWSASRNK